MLHRLPAAQSHPFHVRLPDTATGVILEQKCGSATLEGRTWFLTFSRFSYISYTFYTTYKVCFQN